LDAAENETLLFKTQLREGNVLASIAEARTGRPPQKRADRSDGAIPAPATLAFEACLKPVRLVNLCFRGEMPTFA
jgi:hypothetical protein